jgi:hypothetical protein
VLWDAGVDRQVRAAGFENRENPDDHFQRTRNEERDQNVGANAQFDQPYRERVGTTVQFCVGKHSPFKSNGRVTRRSSYLVLNQPVESARVADWRFADLVVHWLTVAIHNDAPMTSFMISFVPA